MNINLSKIALIFLFTSGLLACGHHNSETDISVTENDDFYEFSAYFNEAKTRDVQRFVNRCTKPNVIFSGEDDHLKVDTKLQDQTSFKLESSPGELLVKVSKIDNSTASVNRMRKMCEGVKAIIGE